MGWGGPISRREDSSRAVSSLRGFVGCVFHPLIVMCRRGRERVGRPGKQHQQPVVRGCGAPTRPSPLTPMPSDCASTEGKFGSPTRVSVIRVMRVMRVCRSSAASRWSSASSALCRHTRVPRLHERRTHSSCMFYALAQGSLDGAARMRTEVVSQWVSGSVRQWVSVSVVSVGWGRWVSGVSGVSGVGSVWCASCGHLQELEAALLFIQFVLCCPGPQRDRFRNPDQEPRAHC